MLIGIVISNEFDVIKLKRLGSSTYVIYTIIAIKKQDKGKENNTAHRRFFGSLIFIHPLFSNCWESSLFVWGNSLVYFKNNSPFLKYLVEYAFTVKDEQTHSFRGLFFSFIHTNTVGTT